MEKVWNSDELLPKKIKSIMKITLLFCLGGYLCAKSSSYGRSKERDVL